MRSTASIPRPPAAARSWRSAARAGGVIEPSAFDLAPDGRFVVADAPNGRERLQVFDFAGTWLDRLHAAWPRDDARVSIDGLALGGVSTLAFLGNGIALNQPETGSLITEYGLAGTPVRSIGDAARRPATKTIAQLHLAMNTGIPLPHPAGGYYFVFYAGTPIFRRYDAQGRAAVRAGDAGPRARSGRRADAEAMAAADGRRQGDPVRAADGADRGRRSRRQAVGVVRDARSPMCSTPTARRSAPCSFGAPASSRRPACFSPTGSASW